MLVIHTHRPPTMEVFLKDTIIKMTSVSQLMPLPLLLQILAAMNLRGLVEALCIVYCMCNDNY